MGTLLFLGTLLIFLVGVCVTIWEFCSETLKKVRHALGRYTAKELESMRKQRDRDASLARHEELRVILTRGLQERFGISDDGGVYMAAELYMLSSKIVSLSGCSQKVADSFALKHWASGSYNLANGHSKFRYGYERNYHYKKIIRGEIRKAAALGVDVSSMVRKLHTLEHISIEDNPLNHYSKLLIYPSDDANLLRSRKQIRKEFGVEIMTVADTNIIVQAHNAEYAVRCKAIASIAMVLKNRIEQVEKQRELDLDIAAEKRRAELLAKYRTDTAQ